MSTQIKLADLTKQYHEIKSSLMHDLNQIVEQAAFIKGSYVADFETAFADYLGIDHCVAVANGTDALEIALEALALPKGSEVILPANTFVATLEAIVRNGLIPIFCDCADDYTIDVNKIEALITKKTKAIIAVHLYGLTADMKTLANIADSRKLFLVEDSAQAHGAMYDGKKAGTLGDIATFSHFPGKNLGAFGDAGSIVTKDKALALRCRMIADHGRITKYEHVMNGRNSRMDTIQAAVLCNKLKHLDKWNSARNNNATFLNTMLQSTDCILPEVPENCFHVYHQYVIRTKDRDQLSHYLKEQNINTGVHYPMTLTQLPMYEENKAHHAPKAEKFAKEILSLPVHEFLTREELIKIANSIVQFRLKRAG